MLKAHPEYILYILSEEEYQDLRSETITERKVQVGRKLINLGLAEFARVDGNGYFLFASDSYIIFEKTDSKAFRKKVYRQIDRFDRAVGNLILLYGDIELDCLYEIYREKYQSSLSREEFLRFLSWHVRMRGYITTFQTLEGKAFAARIELDIQKVHSLQVKYADDLEYKEFSRREIDGRTKDLNSLSDWVNLLFEYLHYERQLPKTVAATLLEEAATRIADGCSMSELYGILELPGDEEDDLETRSDEWTSLTGLMLDFPLPWLKGRNRLEYAETKQISPWRLEMVETEKQPENRADVRMCEFPAEIQEKMHEAGNYAGEKSIEELLEYQLNQDIHSEEFLYLLAESCILTGYDEKKTDRLIRILQKSSPDGRRAAGTLKKRMQERELIADDWQNNMSGEYYEWKPQMPVVRQTPKIGRNDPCPCGSGKKYKKCCGK